MNPTEISPRDAAIAHAAACRAARAAKRHMPVWTGPSLVGADLSGANLRDGVFHLDFTGANLVGADLGGADMSWSRFDGADLRGVVFTGSTMGGSYRGANMERVLLVLNSAGQDFEGARLSGSALRGDWRNVILRGADLTGVDFTNADLRGADLTGANLAGAVLVGCLCGYASFIRANFTGAKVSDFFWGAGMHGSIGLLAPLAGADYQSTEPPAGSACDCTGR
jgi:uncharacterized protein YjbI with pentapeptide repeats